MNESKESDYIKYKYGTETKTMPSALVAYLYETTKTPNPVKHMNVAKRDGFPFPVNVNLPASAVPVPNSNFAIDPNSGVMWHTQTAKQIDYYYDEATDTVRIKPGGGALHNKAVQSMNKILKTPIPLKTPRFLKYYEYV